MWWKFELRQQRTVLFSRKIIEQDKNVQNFRHKKQTDKNQQRYRRRRKIKTEIQTPSWVITSTPMKVVLTEFLKRYDIFVISLQIIKLSSKNSSNRSVKNPLEICIDHSCIWYLYFMAHASAHYFIIVIRKRKDSLETWAVLLIFSLELEISGVAVQSISKQQKMVTFVKNCVTKITLSHSLLL